MRFSGSDSNRRGEMRDRGAAAERAFAGSAQGKSIARVVGGNSSRGTNIFCEATGRHVRGKGRAGVLGRSRTGQGHGRAVWNWLCAERWRFAAAAFSWKVSGKNFG